MFGNFFKSLFNSGSWDSKFLFSQLAIWTKNEVRPPSSYMPHEILLKPDFKRAMSDLQWASEHDGKSHGTGLYATADETYLGPPLSGDRFELFVRQPSYAQRWEADPYDWNLVTTIKEIDGVECFRKTVDRSISSNYTSIMPIARFVAPPPTIAPVTKQHSNAFFSLSEVSNVCWQKYRFLNGIITTHFYIVVATQETILLENVLYDKSIPLLDRLNTMHFLTYKGLLKDGVLVRLTDTPTSKAS